MLTDAQKHQFETLGFLCLRQLIPQDEMKIYIDAFDNTMQEGTVSRYRDAFCDISSKLNATECRPFPSSNNIPDLIMPAIDCKFVKDESSIGTLRGNDKTRRNAH